MITVIEKLIEEIKRVLKFKIDAEEKMYSVIKERDDLKNKLKVEEEKGNDFLFKVNMLKNRF